MIAARSIAVRRVALRAPVVITRSYAPDSRQEGATGSSKGFSQREQAEEGQYIKKRENERLEKARQKLKEAQDHLADEEKKAAAESKR